MRDLLAYTTTPDGTDIALVQIDGVFIIQANGRDLMASDMHGSEESLARLACAGLPPQARVLIGGLGMGFTLRATLDAVPMDARVVVAELVPAIVDWNRDLFGSLNDDPLHDPRVQVQIGDVATVMQDNLGAFDAILLDVDNGPRAFTQANNEGLYGDLGLAAAYSACKPGGVFAVWSAWQDAAFEERMRNAGFAVDSRRVRGHGGKGTPHHVVFLGVTAGESDWASAP